MNNKDDENQNKKKCMTKNYNELDLKTIIRNMQSEVSNDKSEKYSHHDKRISGNIAHSKLNDSKLNLTYVSRESMYF